jgi:hypothetical protein
VEGNRFDELTKSVATSASRRRVLRGIVAGAVASIGAAVGVRSADAALKRKVGEICRKDGDCATGLTCQTASYGRQRCCFETHSMCGDTCCYTYCDPVVGCLDNTIGTKCWDFCLSTFCYGVNTNFTFNSAAECEQYCAYNYCGIS